MLGNDNPQIVLRRVLLNSLTKAPVPKEVVIAAAARDLGVSRGEVLRAARWWNCSEETRDGEVYWRKPNVLVALPRWNYEKGSLTTINSPE